MPRFQTLLLVLIVAHALPLCAQTPTAPTYEQLFNRALELQQAGDTLGAIDTYKAALGLDYSETPLGRATLAAVG